MRLICELDELLNRVQNESRLAYFKTRDVELIKKRFAEEQVFFSKMSNEFTLDVTDLAASESAKQIMDYIVNNK